MERHANYALVGSGTLGLFVGLFAFIVWLAGFQFNRHYDIYDILFIGPVRGISEGGEVHFNGIKVGEVTKLQLDPINPNHVIARVRLTSGVPIRSDSLATLEPQGITGVNYIQLNAGTPGKPMLKVITPRGEVPVIHSQTSTLADLLAGGGVAMQRAIEALDRVNKLLSDENIQAITATLQDVRSVADEARERRAILADLQKTVQDADKTAQAVTELSQSSNKLVNGDAKRALAKLGDAADDLEQTSHQANDLIARLKGPAADFATNGLPQLSSTMVSLQQTAQSLDGLIKDVRQSPTGALSKAPAKEVKVKP